MEQPKEKSYIQVPKAGLIIAVLVLVAGLLGWWIGRSDTPPANQQSSNVQESEEHSSASNDVTSLVSFTLPDSWKQVRCEGNGAVFVVPSGAQPADCSANPVSPVKLAVDPGNHNDCNQLQNVVDVKKHVCISLYINDQRSLKASTEYLETSSYKQPTTINAYYIDTGRGIVKVEHIFTTNNQYQAGFDELANSVKAK